MTDDTNTHGDDDRHRAQDNLRHGDWFFEQGVAEGHAAFMPKLPSVPMAYLNQASLYAAAAESLASIEHHCYLVHPEISHQEWKQKTFLDRYGISADELASAEAKRVKDFPPGGESTMAHSMHPTWITPECPHCSGTGHPYSYRNQRCGYCMPVPDEGTVFSKCGECNRKIWWQDCPTGGWWIHDNHPEDHHDAVPTPGLLERVETIAKLNAITTHEVMKSIQTVQATTPIDLNHLAGITGKPKSNSRYRREPVPGMFDKIEPKTVHLVPVGVSSFTCPTQCCRVPMCDLDPDRDLVTEYADKVTCPDYLTGKDKVIGHTIHSTIEDLNKD
jgi:hypothetical protein